jgi:hypothetical protein
VVSTVPPGPGWWLASDGNWYSPEQRPGFAPRPSYVQAGGSSAPYAPVDGPSNPYGFGPPPALPGFAFGYGDPIGQLPYPYPAPPKRNGLAVASMVCSFFFWVYGIGAILGIVFGFVSRSQIKRSGGTQSGMGMALAGIIIGIVSLVIILPAIAIPTFLGVKAASTASTISVQHGPPTPIALGEPQQGTLADPIPWKTAPLPGATLTVVPGGVNMSIARGHQTEWAAVPVAYLFRSIQLTANVAVVSGSPSNGIGLGCISPDLKDQIRLFVYNTGLWRIVGEDRRAEQILDSGFSPSIHPTGPNALTIACSDDLARPGNVAVSFGANGTPLGSDIVGLASRDWLPTIQLCSCASPDTGSYLDSEYFASPDN